MASLCVQVFTFTWREDIRPGDPQHTKKFCFDAVSHTSPVTLYDCHSMKGNQLWKYRKVRRGVERDGQGSLLYLKKNKVPPLFSPEPPPSCICYTNLPDSPVIKRNQKSSFSIFFLIFLLFLIFFLIQL